MSLYKDKEFNIPEIKGISQKQIEEHLKLYNGYVAHANKILEHIESLKETDEGAYFAAELQRRFGFEFDGMRSHEYYFKALEGGPSPLPKESELAKFIEKQYGNLEKTKKELERVALTRGSGWAILYWDKKYQNFLTAWIDEHHIGHLSSLDIIVAVDMWEHAFMVDYLPGEKRKYFESYMGAINWKTVEDWFSEASRK